jgi:hypothetical protein
VRSFGAAAAIAAGLVVVPLASAAAPFGRPAEIPLVRTPVAVAVADPTQDGIQDLVLANATGPVLTMLPGRQDGSFERPLDIGSGPAPRSFAVGDLDNDGGDDLAVAGGGEIAIYLSADATLVRRAVLTAPSASTVALTDLDLDGNYDLVAAGPSRSIVSVFVGLGDGTFLPAQEYATGGPPASLLATDLNGDEIPDVVTGGNNGVSVLFGNGDGTLRPQVSAGGPSGVLAITGEDFDRDGSVDLAVAHSPNVVDVLRNTGDEHFAPAGSYVVGVTPGAIGAAYVDGDGELDLVTANRGTNDVSVLLGLGDGRFGQQTRIRVGKAPVGLAIDDLDADGANDLVAANRLSKSVTILLNGVDAPQPVVCLVPGVARRTLAVARQLVEAANCKVAGVRRKYSARVRRGRVISVTPLPGTRHPVETAVTLLVSRGPKR